LNSRMRNLTAALLIALPTTTVFAGETPAALIDANVLVIKAEQAEKQGNISEAVAFYEQSVTRFIDVTRSHPQWKPELVRYRIAQSENQAARLRTILQAMDQASVEKVPEVPTHAASESPVAASVIADTRDEEIAILEEGLQKLERENLALKHQLEEATNAVVGARGEISLIAGANAALSNRVDELSVELNRQQNLLAAAESAQSELDELRSKLDAAASQRNALETADREKASEVELLKSRIEALQQELSTKAHHDGKIEKLQDTASELESRIEAAQRLNGELELTTRNQASEIEALKAGVAGHVETISQRDETIRQREAELESLKASVKQQESEAAALAVTAADAVIQTGQLASLSNELASARTEIARLTLEFESAVKMNQEFDRARRELETERNRLVAQLKDAENGADQDQQPDEAAKLTRENDQLKREIDGLNHTIERMQKKNPADKLRAQNSALIEENRVMRANLAKLEKESRDLRLDLQKSKSSDGSN